MQRARSAALLDRATELVQMIGVGQFNVVPGIEFTIRRVHRIEALRFGEVGGQVITQSQLDRQGVGVGQAGMLATLSGSRHRRTMVQRHDQDGRIPPGRREGTRTPVPAANLGAAPVTLGRGQAMNLEHVPRPLAQELLERGEPCRRRPPCREGETR